MKEFFTKVVGVAYDNDDGRSRQAYIKPLRAGDRLCLEHHPHNPYDANAIAVLAPYRRWFKTRWRQIGHLNAELAERIVLDLDQGKRVQARVKEVTGGTRGKPALGVNIVMYVSE